MSEHRVYKVVFLNQGEVYELYAESVGQGSMLGFIEIEGLLFGERTQMVIDPSEERLQNEFKGVQRIHLPMHAVVRIEEVEKQGTSRVAGKAEGGNLMPFPAPLVPGGSKKG